MHIKKTAYSLNKTRLVCAVLHVVSRNKLYLWPEFLFYRSSYQRGTDVLSLIVIKRFIDRLTLAWSSMRYGLRDRTVVAFCVVVRFTCRRHCCLVLNGCVKMRGQNPAWKMKMQKRFWKPGLQAFLVFRCAMLNGFIYAVLCLNWFCIVTFHVWLFEWFPTPACVWVTCIVVKSKIWM